MRRLGSALVLLSALAACGKGDAADEGQGPSGPAKPVVTAAADDSDIARGRALAEQFECVRCHAVPELAPADPKKDCVGCHQDIEAGQLSPELHADVQAEVLHEWQETIVHLTAVPDLHASGRLRRAWLEQFLQDPHDLRPSIEATMPRLDIDSDEARALAAFLSPEEETRVSLAGDLDRGREVVEQRGCGTCHAFSGLEAPLKNPSPIGIEPGADRLAPDLRFTRERMRPDRLVQWIQNPASLHPSTLMPNLGLGEKDATDAAAFLLETPLRPEDPVEVPARLEPLDRPVSFAEVDARVFKKTCWHCHSDPDYAPMGDGGPGNTGGFGFPGRALDLASYEAMASGARDDEGQRRSIFRRLEDGTPALVAHLHARHAEVAGRPVEGVRGMPLGLPPLSLEDIQLVESWIAQGRPR